LPLFGASLVQSLQGFTIARTGRAARAAARMARLLRVVKLYSLQFNTAQGANFQSEGVTIEPSKVGNKLIEQTTIKIIVIVIIIVFVNVAVEIITTDITGNKCVTLILTTKVPAKFQTIWML
jgi:hypothetical protein